MIKRLRRFLDWLFVSTSLKKQSAWAEGAVAVASIQYLELQILHGRQHEEGDYTPERLADRAYQTSVEAAYWAHLAGVGK